MSYVFSDMEKTEIFNAANICKGMRLRSEELQYEALELAGAGCAPLYQKLFDIIDGRVSEILAVDEETAKVLKSARLWLAVAIDANGGNGAYSALIRGYTSRQGELRLNKIFSEDLMQLSSNQVAVNFINTLIDGSLADRLAPWTVPSISQIAEIDASAIGEALFSKVCGEDDTAVKRNAGWSGTVGFSLLGGAPPYETWRLISAGDSQGEDGGPPTQAKANRLDDYKNILFAIDSYSVGLRAAISNFGVNPLQSLLSVVPEQINIALASGSLNPLIQHVVKGTPVSVVVDLILRYGQNEFLDMFKRTYDGDSAAPPTTDETFATNAYAFFSAFSPEQSQSIVTRSIGEYGNADSWAKLAGESTPIGLALRNSLKHLSEIVIERDDGYPGRGLELYDPLTGEGFITAQWLADRAQMLARLIARSQGSFGEQSLQKFSYSDLASAKQALMTTGVLNPLVMFGDDGGRSFAGGANADHLYGGVGNDTINGLAGQDVIEGGGGNDLLAGGDGNDALYGMAGDDVLLGGKGNDSLIGGAGSDRYEFSSGDGIDEIFEANANGQLWINGSPIPSLKRRAPLSDVWSTEDQAITLTLIEELSEPTLNIKYGLNDLVVIKNFRPGMLGIRLPEYQGHTVSAPDLVLQGDWKAKDIEPNVPGDQFSYDELGNALLLPNVKHRNKADVLYGSAKDDVILGLGGSDRLFGKAGNDQLFGDKQTTLEKAMAAGDSKGKAARGDWLDGGAGHDLLIGTASQDVLLGGNDRDTLIGGAGDDILSGDETTGALEQKWGFTRVKVLIDGGVTSHRTVFSKASFNSSTEGNNDVLYGQAGRDVLNGGWGEDLLDGGTEDDLLRGEEGNDTLAGGSGNDTMMGDNLDWGGGLQSKHHGNDVLDGGSGDDWLAGNGGADAIYGGSGNDTLHGDDIVLNGVAGDAAHFFGNDLLDGGAGDDTLWGGGADDLLFGGEGNDALAGDYAEHPVRYHGNDLLDGGAGDDTLQGMGGSDTLIGGAGADAMDGDVSNLQSGGINNDYLQGGEGNDTLLGGLGADTLYGGADDDILSGDYEQTAEAEHGADYLDGGSGNDTLLGGGGNDTLVGGEGVDHLRGDSGNNVFDGGAGNDVMEGHDGADVYYFGVGDGLDVITDSGGSNVIKFGAGFSAERLKADIIDVSVGRVLRLFNGEGDAILIRNYEEWKNSTFSFSDGVVLGYEDVLRKTLPPIKVPESPVPEVVTASGIQQSKVEDPVHPDTIAAQRPVASDHPVDWTEKFLAQIKSKRYARKHATGFTLSDQGVWVRSHITTSDTGYITHTELSDDGVEAGTLSETPPWMKVDAGQAVVSERQSKTTSRVEHKQVKADGAIASSSQAPRYYRSGSANGFSFNTGDVLVEDRKESGALEGWYIYPATSFGSGETVPKAFRWDVTTETIKRKIVPGDDAGGRVNVEVENVFHGGAGDDLIVGYAGSPLDYGTVGGRTPGAFLSAGAGDDTLLGSEGADYLVSGAGDDWLYGEDGADTYIVQAHAGATTTIADVPNPVFHRAEVGAAGWKDEYGLIDQDTVVLPADAQRDALQLSWGAALIETTYVELEPNPGRGAHRNPPRAKMLHPTLDINWGGIQKVRIVLPLNGELEGAGIELLNFADGSVVSLKQLLESSQLGPAPETFHTGVTVNNSTRFTSLRDGRALPLVGGRGNDTISGAGEIRGMEGDDVLTGSPGDDLLLGGPGNDTLTGGAGNDIYRYDGLGRDVIINRGDGLDGIDFSERRLKIDNLKFHRERDDLVIVVDYGMAPKIRVSNHFAAGESAIGFIRVSEGTATQDYSAMQIAERLHPLPPLRDVEDILIKGDEEAQRAMTEIIQFYELNV
ncbi:calcium-binding protein [Pseudomonas sp. SCA2728.1_7]|uniref:calcium-binding protein n=1 Tax=Pseudomonas sp. SCA2728.1_7 TaxID=2825975 RepID=UPI001BB094FC|nr:calcium-binding protein [Pseudomonas sp. SCA2728.1_7]QUE92989.1 calcium-binding protein [Pseudomonas sp. SCA2728.1_7]